MLRSKHEEKIDLGARLRELEQLGAASMVAPRQPLDDLIQAPAAMRAWELRKVVPGGGRIYAVGPSDGPGFRSATWLAPARRATR